MSKPPVTPDEDELSPLLIGRPTITQFEKAPTSSYKLYDELFEQNQELALWLRRRAIQLAPDIDDREVITTLALELFGILNNHLAVESLRKRLSL